MRICLLFILCLLVVSCNGAGGDEATVFPTPTPTPGTDGTTLPLPALVERSLSAVSIQVGSEFGQNIKELAGGNIIIREEYSSLASDGGSVHLINPFTGELISTLEGDNNNDSIGTILFPLSNGHYLVVSNADDTSGISSSGSVKLLNGESGAIIASIEGDSANDSLGGDGVFELPNGNFVICSGQDDVGGLANTGSVIIADSITGSIIKTLSGDDAGDQLGSKCGYSLNNGNFILRSPLDENAAGQSNAGSIKTVNETTGLIVSTFEGSVNNSVGSGDVIHLGSGRLAVSVSTASVGPHFFNGAVYIIDTATGSILHTIAGENDSDFFSDNGLYNLDNGNFVVGTNFDATLASSGGSVRLVNGMTGAIIASHIGDDANDRYGQNGIVVMPNGNFAFAQSSDDIGGFSNLGSVRIASGTTGAEIGAYIGDGAGDGFGASGITALSNNNIAVASFTFFYGAIVEAGRVTVLDGTDASEIASVYGDSDLDNLGDGGVIALKNNNFLAVSKLEDDGGVNNRGSVRLINGSNGAVITKIDGDASSSLDDIKVYPLNSGDVVIVIPDVNSGQGTAYVLDGDDGSLLKTYSGATPGDFSTSNFVELSSGGVAIGFSEFVNQTTTGAGIVEVFPIL